MSVPFPPFTVDERSEPCEIENTNRNACPNVSPSQTVELPRAVHTQGTRLKSHGPGHVPCTANLTKQPVFPSSEGITRNSLNPLWRSSVCGEQTGSVTMQHSAMQPTYLVQHAASAQHSCHLKNNWSDIPAQMSPCHNPTVIYVHTCTTSCLRDHIQMRRHHPMVQPQQESWPATIMSANNSSWSPSGKRIARKWCHASCCNKSSAAGALITVGCIIKATI